MYDKGRKGKWGREKHKHTWKADPDSDCVCVSVRDRLTAAEGDRKAEKYSECVCVLWEFYKPAALSFGWMKFSLQGATQLNWGAPWLN